MLRIIGLGLSDRDLTFRGREALSDSDEAYAEIYTNAIDYDFEPLSDSTGTSIEVLEREEVEEKDRVLERASEIEVAFLVSGDPLAATTHQDLLFRARDQGVEVEVFHAPSIFTAVGETGLSLYKFGRTTTVPEPYSGSLPDSVFEVIEDNSDIGLHTLVLVDMSLEPRECFELLDGRIEGPVLVCSGLGEEDPSFLYGPLGDIPSEKVSKPFSVVVPGEISENELERVERWKI